MQIDGTTKQQNYCPDDLPDDQAMTGTGSRPAKAGAMQLVGEPTIASRSP